MTVDILESEPLLTLAEAARKLRVGKRTIDRYVGPGVRGVRLESVCIGWRRYVNVEMLNRFIAATTASKPKYGNKNQGNQAPANVATA